MTEDEAKELWPITGKKNGHSKGYVRLRCPTHPNATKEGYVYEHTYVASVALGRGLKRGEMVHHVNGIEHDNRPVNLLVCGHSYHRLLHERLAESPDWPQFKKRKTNRPRCVECGVKISYYTERLLCRKHFNARVAARSSVSVCKIYMCGKRAGLRSGLCRQHVNMRSNKRRYHPTWDFPDNHYFPSEAA